MTGRENSGEFSLKESQENSLEDSPEKG